MENKKVVIITGAAKGIGRATAFKFARNGYRVTLVDIDKKLLADTGEDFKKDGLHELLLLSGNIADVDFMKLIIDQSLEEWGRIDVLVNNAAWRTIETMRTMEMDTWEQTLSVCLTAPAFMTKWTTEIMERLQISGSIINVSSMMAERVAGTSPAYIAAKGALESLTRELAITYGRRGIRVLSVQPGYIETDISKDYQDANGDNISELLCNNLVNATPLARGGTADEIAEAIFWLSSDAASFITGTTLLVDGGFKHNMTDYTIKNLQFPNQF